MLATLMLVSPDTSIWSGCRIEGHIGADAEDGVEVSRSGGVMFRE
jgi:hypothetical protein